MTAETTKTSEVTGYSSTPGHPSIRWTAWFRWLLATFLGLLGGFAVFLMIGTTAGEFIDAVFPSFVFGLILGAIFGTAFGIAHWLFLRRYLEGIGIWIPTTALAFTLAAAAIFGLFGDENPEQVTFLMRLSHGILVGMSLGVAQWLVLRSKLGGQATAWVAATVLAWTLGELTGIILTELAVEEPLPLMLTFLVGASLSGIGMVWLLRRHDSLEAA